MFSRFKSEFGTIFTVTLVTVLIWIWAAGEMREDERFSVKLRFEAPPGAALVVNSSQTTANITVEGSKRALRQFLQIAGSPLAFTLGAGDVPAEAGDYTLDMSALMRAHPIVDETGVRVLESDPPSVSIVIDDLVDVVAEVRPRLPSVQTEGDITITPETATLRMPARLRQSYPENMVVDAAADPNRLAQLQPGVRHELSVKLRPPDTLTNNPNVSITPAASTVSFLIRSQIRETTLESVIVQLAGPFEDADDYHVEFTPRQLQNITVRAETELIRRIESGDVPVVAVVHLSSREKEQGLQRKRVTSYLALIPEDGGTRAESIDDVREDAADRPMIDLTITERVAAP